MKTLLISAGAFALAASWLPVGKLLTGLFIIAAILFAAAAMLAPAKKLVVEHVFDALRGLK